MEHNINDTRLQVYYSMSHSKQYLYDSIGFSMLALNLATKFNVDDNLLDKIQLTIGDIILGFYKIEDTVPLIQQELGLDAKTAALLGADVLDFLAPLSNPNWQPPVDEDGENAEFSDQTTNEVSPVTLSTPEVVSQIEEPSHHESTTIPEIRTMAADMAIERSPDRSTFNAAADFEEPAYVSTQPIIEKKVTDVPSYSSSQYPLPKSDAPITDSRWN